VAKALNPIRGTFPGGTPRVQIVLPADTGINAVGCTIHNTGAQPMYVGGVDQDDVNASSGGTLAAGASIYKPWTITEAWGFYLFGTTGEPYEVWPDGQDN